MLAFSLLAVGGVVITGQVVGRSLFLSALPPWAIPFRFLLPPLALVAAVALHGRAARRMTPRQLVTATFGPIVAFVVVARILMPTPVGETLAFLLTLAVMLDAAGNVVMIVFWTIAGDVFDAREAKRKQEDVVKHESHRALEAICLELEQLAAATDKDDNEVRRSLRDLEDQWRKRSGGADPAARKIEARFRDAKAAATAALSARGRLREASVWQTLAAKERLCEELDAMVATRAAPATDWWGKRCPECRPAGRSRLCD